MTKQFIVILILLSLGSLSAQRIIPSLSPVNSQQITLVQDTLRILGVMVNFQEDKDGSTFGNGKFGSIYSGNYGTEILDPLPHDKPYFEAHLEFVKNYFDRVSGNQLHIEYYIFPDTFSVSQTMRNYSPAGNTSDFTLLGNFAAEVWHMADSIYPRFDFSNFDVFSIFHAGVGRDISLPGSLGNERDLPSVYLGLKTLKGIYGADFEGFDLENNGFKVPNSMIIPETESRELSSFGNTFLFEITINGLIAANIGSHLGLPDLFDTNTGLSAIGRFGLMDGQSIFAYNGVFPPEPSAWEKIYLGWAQPVELSPGNYEIDVVTKLAAEISDTVILKVPISSTEYYLIENRIRDARGDGARLTYVQNGEVKTKVFPKDTTGFYSFSIDSLAGVITNVDEFDWAVPGNGIVIWHIDENIINAKIAENKINTDKFNRGVDIEEADGIQDIGERFITIFGDEVIGEGTEDDFWFAGNPSQLFENRFSMNTRPDTKTNSGANSLISMFDFSDISNRMTLKIAYGDSIIKPVFAVQINNLTADKSSITVTDSAGVPNFAVMFDSTLYWMSDSGSVENSITPFSIHKPASVILGGNKLLAGTTETQFIIYLNGVPVFDPLTVNGSITAPPVIRKTPTEAYDLLIGTSTGRILIYSIENTGQTALRDSVTFPGNSSVIKIAADGFRITALLENNDASSSDQFFIADNENIIALPEVSAVNNFILTKDKNGNYLSILLADSQTFHVYSNTALINSFASLSSKEINTFSVADIKQDGENYIIYSGDRLYAVNFSGVLAENFPFNDPQGLGFTGMPLAADVEGDTRSEIFAYTIDGRIFAVDGGTGSVVPGFPLTAGNQLSAVPAIFNYYGRSALALLNQDSYLYTWTVGSTPPVNQWVEEFGNNQNTSFIGSASNKYYNNEFFPVSRAYNYPNPVYDGRTFIRYYVAENSKINIKIFDLAGDFVAELNDDATGGLDNETMWDVGSIQSGIYLARVEANASSGKSESTIIKIAVVK